MAIISFLSGEAVCGTSVLAQAPAAASSSQDANQGTHSVWDGVYTADQSKHGEEIAARECSSCHGETMAEGDQAPALAGDSFTTEWNGQTLDGLFHKISTTMPQTAPGKLSREEYLDLLARILNLNGIPAGKTELGSAAEPLQQIRFEAAKPKQNGNAGQKP